MDTIWLLFYVYLLGSVAALMIIGFINVNSHDGVLSPQLALYSWAFIMVVVLIVLIVLFRI